jgi:c-di-GMP-binding flagellar brake protein YcgR
VHQTALWLEVSKDEPLWRVLTADVSAGGIQIEVRQALPVGLEFKIHLELPMFLDLITANCRVRHCTQSKGLHRIGIEFTSVLGITEEQLVAFLEAYFSA